MRRVAMAVLLLSGCYFETPTHRVQEDGGSADAGEPEAEAGADDGGLDAELEDAADGGGDPICACDAGQVCLPGTSTCVECTEASHCSLQAPVCRANRCMGCTTGTDCASYSATPACNAASGMCVECTSESAGACKGISPVCDAQRQKCVACNANSDCKDPTKPICEAHACRACTAKADCAAQGLSCRLQTGECVACLPDKDNPELEGCSNGNACHPTAFTCTGAPRRSVPICGDCASDSECVSGSRCVATQFKGAPHGSYCLVQQATGLCPNRYKAKRTASSALGVSAEYCFPNDSFTTCEAIREFGNECPMNPAECGANELPDDGLCKAGRCTYGCDGDSDCASTQAGSCFSDVSGPYCRIN